MPRFDADCTVPRPRASFGLKRRRSANLAQVARTLPLLHDIWGKFSILETSLKRAWNGIAASGVVYRILLLHERSITCSRR